MGKKWVSAALVCCLLAAVMQTAAFAEMGTPYPDVPADAPYGEAVSALYDCGIMEGDSAGNFNPNSTLTRAEAATVICRIMGGTEEAEGMTADFQDVPANHWAAPYIGFAQQRGVILGYGNGRFGPGDTLSYEQFIKMLVCAYGLEAPAESAGGWPEGYLDAAARVGFTSGMSFDQKGAIPRWAVAQLCYQAMFGE